HYFIPHSKVELFYTFTPVKSGAFSKKDPTQKWRPIHFSSHSKVESLILCSSYSYFIMGFLPSPTT
ncbi:MAG: hypothetical protein IKE90_02145, partial [Bacilli bacterium]|nr:hypothetical protein [Bacilli bacterium]